MRRLLVILMLRSPLFASGAPFVEKHPQRDFIARSLQKLVDQSGETGENHFFVFRKNKDDWIFWREGRLLWKTDMSPYYEKRGSTEVRARAIWDLRLAIPWKPIELNSDVVPTQADVGSSTYLQPRGFVADIVYDCVLNGELLVLHKKRPNQSPEPTAMSVTPPAAQEPRQP